MAGYLSSEKVIVFPSTKRGNKQVTSRLFSEENVVSIVNKLLDTDSFVITPDTSFGLDSSIEFNIHGYYFKVADVQSIITTAAPTQQNLSIYANILVNTDGDYHELQGQDDETESGGVVTASEYQGLKFTTAPLSPGQNQVAYSLVVLSRAGSSANWTIPATSRYKFSRDSLNIVVDGGRIE